MTKNEAVNQIAYGILEPTVEFFSGKDEAETEFARTFEELGEQKRRGIRIYYPSQMIREFVVAYYIAATYSLVTKDGGDSRHSVLGKDLSAAFTGFTSNDGEDTMLSIRRFNATVQMYQEYLNGVSSTGMPNFYSVIAKAGLPMPVDDCEKKALAYRLWTFVCLERVLLGTFYKPERQGDLCFRFLPMANQFASDMERVFTEYCGPCTACPKPIAERGSGTCGCLVPLLAVIGSLFSFVFIMMGTIAR